MPHQPTDLPAITPITREDVLANALITIAELPCAEQDDMPAANMRNIAREAVDAAIQLMPTQRIGNHGFAKPDTCDAVLFYEQEFYPLSNFSAFAVEIFGVVFPTSEHAYHYAKFIGQDSREAMHARRLILTARSAHAAFELGQSAKAFRRADWEAVKEGAMREILVAKTRQNPYVAKKLAATGHARLIEDSWRDDYWGWGPNRDGKNRLGAIWEAIRHDLRAELITLDPPRHMKWEDASEDAMWTLAEFIAAEHDGVEAFAKTWLKGVADKPESYPLECTPGDWDEQFCAFRSGEAP